MLKISRAAVLITLSFVFFVFFASPAPAVESSEVFGRIAGKYGDFEKAFGEMSMRMHIVSRGGTEEIRAGQQVYKKGDKVRVESTLEVPDAEGAAGARTIVIHDGQNTYVVSPEAGIRKVPDGAKVRTEENWWTRLSESGKVLGQENVEGNEAYVIEVTGEGAEASRIWVDKERLVLLKAESRMPDGKTAAWKFSDFRKVKDWEIPFRTEMYLDGEPASVTRIESFDPDEEIPDRMFDPEAAFSGLKSK